MRDLGVGSDPAGRLRTGEELKFSTVWVHDVINQEFNKQTNKRTVHQSRCRTIVVGAHRLPESHQTGGRTGTYELEGKIKNSSRRLWSNNKSKTLFIRRRNVAHTSSALPQSPEAFLSHNLPEAIDDSRVSGLSRPRCNLQTRLHDISRCHQRGCRDTWEIKITWRVLLQNLRSKKSVRTPRANLLAFRGGWLVSCFASCYCSRS